MKGSAKLLKIIAVGIVAAIQTVCTVYAGQAESSSNMHRGYTSAMRYAQPVMSNIYEDDGGIIRVEYVQKSSYPNGMVVVEKYDKDGEFLSPITTIEPPSERFGGFYHGKSYNYLVFGTPNTGEDDTVPVFIVQQYTHDWKLNAQTTASNLDVYIPIKSGTLKMAELNDKLFIYSSRTLYTDSSGLNHQKNILLSFYQDPLKFEVCAEEPWCSHSFDQYIATDGSKLYSLDLGDANPRAVVANSFGSTFQRSSYVYNGNSLTEPNGLASYLIMDITGTKGDNNTGVTLGEMRLYGDNMYIAGASVEQTDGADLVNDDRTVFLAIAKKDFSGKNIIWYNDYAGTTGQKPQCISLTSLNDGNFILMWSNCQSSSSFKYDGFTTVILKIDKDGNVLKSKKNHLPLSDCRPLLCADGKIRWYVTYNTIPGFYTLDPETLSCTTTPMEDWNFDSTDGTLYINGTGAMLTSGTMPWAEYQNEIKHIVIGDKVTDIGYSAFSNRSTDAAKSYSNLESVKFGKNITSIKSYAFYSCPALKECVLPDSLEEIASTAFTNCTSLKKISLPDSVKTLGALAFSSCTSLETAELSPNIESIGSYIFAECSSLCKITVPGSTEISSAAFSNCSSLTYICGESSGSAKTFADEKGYVFIDIADMCLYKGTVKETNGSVPTDLYAFFYDKTAGKPWDMVPVTNGTVECSLYKAHEYDIIYCGNIYKPCYKEYVNKDNGSSYSDTALAERIYDAADIASADDLTFVKVSGEGYTVTAGKYKGTAEKVVMPCVYDGRLVKGMQNSIFYGSTSVKTVVLPEIYTAIPGYAFAYSSVTDAVMPDSITSIGDRAFYNCNIDILRLPKNTETVGSYAFTSNNIKAVVLSDNLVSLYDSAYTGRAKLYCRKDSQFDKANAAAHGSQYGYIGDVNNDKNITDADAALVLDIAVGLEDISSNVDMRVRSDWNTDGKTDILDSIGILNK